MEPVKSSTKSYLTVEQVSEKLKVTRQRIYQMIQEKLLKAERVGYMWLVPKDELKYWRRAQMGKRQWLVNTGMLQK